MAVTMNRSHTKLAFIFYSFLLGAMRGWVLNTPVFSPPLFTGENVIVKYIPKSAWGKMCHELFQPYGTYREEGALVNITFNFKGPGPIGLIGESGSGKSTFMKILIQKNDVVQGKMEIIPSNMHPIVYIDRYFDVDLDEKVGKSIMRVLKPQMILSGVCSKILEMTQLEKHFDFPVKDLTGGQIFRYKIALALAQAAGKSTEYPPILLVDELLDRVDLRVRTPVNLLLRKLAEDHGITIFLASHSMIDIKTACNQVITFYRGRIESLGPPEKSKYLKEKELEEMKLKFGVPSDYHFKDLLEPPQETPQLFVDRGLKFVHLPSHEDTFSPDFFYFNKEQNGLSS